MMYPGDKKWWELPLRCLLGLHRFRPHPGTTPDWPWKVCVVCSGEKAGVA